MAMGVKCITWVGNMFQKIEDICVDVDDTVFEETVKYLGNQMQTVGESVKKICSEVMQDLSPLPPFDLDETSSSSDMPVNQNTDAGLAEKSFEGSKQTTEDSRISDDVDNDVIHADTVSKPTSSESVTIASLADCCNEIENTSTKEISNDLELVESAKGKEKHSSYSIVLFVDPYEITETWDLDVVSKIGTIVEQGHKTMQQQDDELKLVETCVMVTRDELQSVLNAEGNLRTSKNKKRQPFLLSKKASRRQEYEELAILHGNNEKGDSAECPTLQNDHKTLMLSDISESDWEVL